MRIIILQYDACFLGEHRKLGKKIAGIRSEEIKMERKIGILASCINGCTEIETLQRIKDNGFDSFFSSEKNTKMEYVSALKNEAMKLGLDYEFIHGPFKGINDMWTSEEEPAIFNAFKSAIDAASNAGVKVVVAHVSSSFYPPQISPLGIARFDAWVEYAEKKGVIIALENLRRLGNFAYLMDRYEDNSYVKYCYDSGHEHCFTVRVPFLPIYGDRLICTHLHDNFGQDKMLANGGDTHLLPFDGNIDFAKVMRELKEVDYCGSLMLEVSNGIYPDLSADTFLKRAYERAKKMSELRIDD